MKLISTLSCLLVVVVVVIIPFTISKPANTGSEKSDGTVMSESLPPPDKAMLNAISRRDDGKLPLRFEAVKNLAATSSIATVKEASTLLEQPAVSNYLDCLASGNQLPVSLNAFSPASTSFHSICRLPA